MSDFQTYDSARQGPSIPFQTADGVEDVPAAAPSRHVLEVEQDPHRNQGGWLWSEARLDGERLPLVVSVKWTVDQVEVEQLTAWDVPHHVVTRFRLISFASEVTHTGANLHVLEVESV